MAPFTCTSVVGSWPPGHVTTYIAGEAPEATCVLYVYRLLPTGAAGSWGTLFKYPPLSSGSALLIPVPVPIVVVVTPGYCWWSVKYNSSAVATVRKFASQAAVWACDRAWVKFGISNAARIAIIATTTIISSRVNPRSLSPAFNLPSH